MHCLKKKLVVRCCSSLEVLIEWDCSILVSIWKGNLLYMTLQITLWFNFMDYVLLYFLKLIAWYVYHGCIVFCQTNNYMLMMVALNLLATLIHLPWSVSIFYITHAYQWIYINSVKRSTLFDSEIHLYNFQKYIWWDYVEFVLFHAISYKALPSFIH